MKNLLCTLGIVLTASLCAFAQQTDTIPKTAENQHKVSGNYQVIEQQAIPIGGMKAFYEFLYKNIRMPKEAIKNGVEGTAYIRFVIDEEGNVPLAEAVEGREVGFGIDEEAIRVIKLTKWVPGVANGVNVPQRMIFPIKFKLTERQKKKKKN